MEGLNGVSTVSRQSRGPKINLQPSKMQVKINLKKLQSIFSWSPRVARDSGSQRTSTLQKPLSNCSKKHSFFLDIKIPYNLVISENIAKFY